jgi:superfamily II DNA/RNA helicase
MNHVIHYHLPSKEDEFTHRNGRTARMLSTGTAYIIAHESEKKMEYIIMDGRFKLESASPPPRVSNHLHKCGKKNKLNKIDIVGFFLRREN